MLSQSRKVIFIISTCLNLRYCDLCHGFPSDHCNCRWSNFFLSAHQREFSKKKITCSLDTVTGIRPRFLPPQCFEMDSDSTLSICFMWFYQLINTFCKCEAVTICFRCGPTRVSFGLQNQLYHARILANVVLFLFFKFRQFQKSL